MGACASKFKLWKSAADAAPPEDVASRDLNMAEEKVRKDIKTPVAVDDERKRHMLGHLFKENNFKESEDVKQEDKPKGKLPENVDITSAQPVTDAPGKDADHGLETNGSEEEKKARDVEPATEYVETEALSQKTTEEKPAETAKVEASEKVENRATERSDEIRKPVEKCGSNKEPEVPCLVKTVIEKATEEKQEAEMMKEVEMPEAEKKDQKPASVEWAMEKEEPEAMAMDINDRQKSASEDDKKDETQDEPVEMTKLQVPKGETAEDHPKPEAEVKENRTEEKLAEASKQDIPENKPEMQETKEQPEVEKPAFVAEKKTQDDDQLPPSGTTKIETDTEKKTEDNQLPLHETTKIESDAEKKTEDDQPVACGSMKIETLETEEDKQAVEAPKAR